MPLSLIAKTGRTIPRQVLSYIIFTMFVTYMVIVLNVLMIEMHIYKQNS